MVRVTREATAPGAGGVLDTPNQRISVTHISPIVNASDLARIPVNATSAVAPVRQPNQSAPQLQGTVPLTRPPLMLGDIAHVVEGHQLPIGDAVINDGPGLLLIVEKQPEGNTLEVTRGVEAALNALRPGLADLQIDSTIFRPATFIEMALANLGQALIIGCLLVVVVLVFFLYDWRTALISLLAIPLSLITAAIVLYYRGGAINTMVIAGLVLALGEVVDDAIISVENIVRRLRVNRETGAPDSAFVVVLKASIEVRSAVVYATLIVVLVFVPIFLLHEIEHPMAVVIVGGIVTSTLLNLFLMPALYLAVASPRGGGAGNSWRNRVSKVLSSGLTLLKRRVSRRNPSLKRKSGEVRSSD